MTDSSRCEYDWRRRLGDGGSGDYLSILAVLRVPWYFLYTMPLGYLKQILTFVVYSLIIDFSTAFDVVDHGTLAAKLTGLNMID